MAFSKIIDSKEARWISQEKYGGRRPFLFWYDLLKHRCGYPIAYIIGNIPFLSTTIDLSYRPFIPREETAYWVTLALKKIKEKSPAGEPLSILDIFSGSGAIGIAVAKELPRAQISFVEKNPQFIKQIKKNLLLNEVKNDVIFLDAKTYPETGPYHYIFANPPYLSKKRKNIIQNSVLLWEPHMALFTKEDGLFYIRSLIESLPHLLRQNGSLFLEHDPWQTSFITEKAASLGFLTETFFDQYKVARMTILTRS